MNKIISAELIEAKILEIRGKKVMLDKELANLYGAPVKVLNQAVKRNIKRFPEDFMFKLTWEEVKSLRSQFVTLNDIKYKSSEKGKHIKYLPRAFTEQGVAMLSSVLNSERAIQVNIQIMRAFIKLKELLLTHKGLAEKISALEKKYATHDEKIERIFEAIKQLLQPAPITPKRKIGFHG